MIQYYQDALHGSWPSDTDARRRARIEFIQYLLQNEHHSRALSEILILSANAAFHATVIMAGGWAITQVLCFGETATVDSGYADDRCSEWHYADFSGCSAMWLRASRCRTTAHEGWTRCPGSRTCERV